MIQAFVALRLNYPERTESGMRTFFEALQSAVFSQPTIFRSNQDSSVRPYSVDEVIKAAIDPGCKFIVLRAESERFWQCTFLLPDNDGMGALYFDLQRSQAPRRLAPETLIEMFKKLYFSMSPRLIRIGDADAREKLSSKHGLKVLPGLGKIEWLHIVSPEVYSDIYNATELMGAPGFQTELWEDGALFLRVYDDPNDWDSEDNVTQANFIPAFLAGIAKTQDSAKERSFVKELERLRTRAEKTAEKAYEALNTDANNVHEDFTAAEPKKQEDNAKEDADFKELAASASASNSEEDLKMRGIVHARLRSEFNVEEENIVKVGTEGICTIFKVKAEKKPVFYATYQDLDRKVFIINNVAEDLSRFIAENGCSVDPEHVEKIKYLLKTYYHPEYKLLDSLDELPENVSRDRRIPDLRAQFKSSEVETVNDNRVLTFWFYKPESQGIETITLTQFEDWPLQAEAKVQCTDMENEPDKTEQPAAASEKAEEKSEEKAEEKSEEKAEEKSEHKEPSMDEDPTAAMVNTKKSVSRKKSVVQATEEVPVEVMQKKPVNKALIGVGAALIVIIIVVAVLFGLGIIGGDAKSDNSAPADNPAPAPVEAEAPAAP